jgi:hypothetical protein
MCWPEGELLRKIRKKERRGKEVFPENITDNSKI